MCFFLQAAEDRQQVKSTGVFQDEELLFSQTQQKDNDPDVDLFAHSGKPAVSVFDDKYVLLSLIQCVNALNCNSLSAS